ncbi:MAG TPA: lipoyl synthase, partial [Anaerovoracaceae bacterium]|nr:lipoyl synthase [Anaerovoracaceae bacterium]
MSVTLEKPEWLKRRISNIDTIEETIEILKRLSLNTVCDGAQCPNIGECFGNKTATFMILGSVCTRQCRFCAVTKGKAETVNHSEPENIGMACKEMDLKHVVVTSVTRDDLPDGGAEHYAKTVNEIKKYNPYSTVELLIPDLKGNWEALEAIVNSKPDIINHNLETVKT